MLLPEMTPSVVSKKNWATKEDTAKSMTHVVKRHILKWNNVKHENKNKPIALLIVEVCLGEGIG